MGRVDSDAEVAVAAARAAAEVIRARYGSPGDRRAKVGIDFVTETDVEAERTVLDVVRSTRPDDAFLGEEAGLVGDPDAARTWLVDPLCGTLNFAARTPLVAVNVALRETSSGASRLTAAAVAEPFADEVSWTDGDLARLSRAGVEEPLTPSAASRLVDIDLNNRPPWAAAFLVDAFAADYRVLAVSSSLAATWVASGRRAGYAFPDDVRDNVHFAAPVAVCRAAGCVVTALDGTPLEDGSPGLLIAADEPTHRDLLAFGEDVRGR